jgi:hypothetical protein
VQSLEMMRSQELGTAVYRMELARGLNALGYEWALGKHNEPKIRERAQHAGAPQGLIMPDPGATRLLECRSDHQPSLQPIIAQDACPHRWLPGRGDRGHRRPVQA